MGCNQYSLPPCGGWLGCNQYPLPPYGELSSIPSSLAGNSPQSPPPLRGRVRVGGDSLLFLQHPSHNRLLREKGGPGMPGPYTGLPPGFPGHSPSLLRSRRPGGRGSPPLPMETDLLLAGLSPNLKTGQPGPGLLTGRRGSPPLPMGTDLLLAGLSPNLKTGRPAPGY